MQQWRKRPGQVSVCTYYLSKESYISITQSGSSRNGGRAGHTSLCYHRAGRHEATRVISRLCLVQVLSFMKSFSWLLHCLCRICKTRSRLVSITALVAIIHFHNSGSRQSSVWNAYLSSFPLPAKVQQWKKRPGQVSVCTYYLSKKSYIAITQSGSITNGCRSSYTSLCYHHEATLEATRVISRLCLVQVWFFMINFSWIFQYLCRICKTRSCL